MSVISKKDCRSMALSNVSSCHVTKNGVCAMVPTGIVQGVGKGSWARAKRTGGWLRSVGSSGRGAGRGAHGSVVDGLGGGDTGGEVAGLARWAKTTGQSSAITGIAVHQIGQWDGRHGTSAGRGPSHPAGTTTDAASGTITATVQHGGRILGQLARTAQERPGELHKTSGRNSNRGGEQVGAQTRQARLPPPTGRLVLQGGARGMPPWPA